MTRNSRRVVLVAMGVCSALLLAFALKIFLMLGFDDAARKAGEEGDHARAAETYSRNLTLNLAEPWVAHANRGAALYRAEDLDGAEKEFRRALPDVPEQYRCMVTLDLAWTVEAQGDKFDGEGQTDKATQRWEEADNILDGKGCGQLDKRTTPTPTPTSSKGQKEPSKGQEEPSEQEQRDQRKKTKERLQKKIDEAGNQTASPEPTPSSSPSTQPSSQPQKASKAQQTKLQQKMTDAERKRRSYEPYERNSQVGEKNW